MDINVASSSKKCLACGYEGEEKICPSCHMPMEDKCQNCNRTKTECVCALVADKK